VEQVEQNVSYSLDLLPTDERRSLNCDFISSGVHASTMFHVEHSFAPSWKLTKQLSATKWTIEWSAEIAFSTPI